MKCLTCKQRFEEGELCPSCYPVVVVVEDSPPVRLQRERQNDNPDDKDVAFGVNHPKLGEMKTTVSRDTANKLTIFTVGGLIAILGVIVASFLGIRPPKA